jgi:uncharacterized protein
MAEDPAVSLGHALLAATLLAMAVAPLLYRWAASESIESFLDGFALITVGGLAAFHLLPEALEHGGAPALGFAVVGALSPALFEHRKNKGDGKAMLFAVLVGILPHVALESAALGAATSDEALGLGVAIVAHRLPVALFVYALLRQGRGERAAGWSIVLLLITTAIGFAVGGSLKHLLDPTALACLHALVGGSLLHVAATRHIDLRSATVTKGACHKHPPDDEPTANDPASAAPSLSPPSAVVLPAGDTTTPRPKVLATLGACLGAVLLAVAQTTSHHHEGASEATSFGATFMTLALRIAPPLLLAYALASLLRASVRSKQAHGLRTPAKTWHALRGLLFGLPMPICSRSALSTYRNLLHSGVPAVVALGFLIAVPQFSIEALLLSIPLLGAQLTAARVLTALAITLSVASLTARFIQTKSAPCEEPLTAPESQGFGQRIRNGFRFGFIELFDHTLPWVLAGLLAAAWVEPLLGHGLLSNVPKPLQVLGFALMGVPLYVCASGATPVAAIAIHKGASAGAALAFVIAGPVLHPATFRLMAKEHGRMAATIFGLSVFSCSVAAGILVDALAIQALLELHNHPNTAAGPMEWLCLFSLGMLFVASVIRQGPRGTLAQVMQPLETPAEP